MFKFSKEELREFFEELKRRDLSFIKYYNHIVLDGGEINFTEFVRKWGIQGIKEEVISRFNKAREKIIKEIIEGQNIYSFFNKYCKGGTFTTRNEISFCSKLFHSIIPAEFPPFDKFIKNEFGLSQNIESILILKKIYKKLIKENKQEIKLAREVLSDKEFAELRAEELSDVRIIDMLFWIKGALEDEGGEIDKKLKTKNMEITQPLKIGGSIVSSGTKYNRLRISKFDNYRELFIGLRLLKINYGDDSFVARMPNSFTVYGEITEDKFLDWFNADTSVSLQLDLSKAKEGEISIEVL